MLKEKFGLKVNNASGNFSRKPGMSIINPYSKRRKVPKGGITFDDDAEGNIDEEDEQSSQSQGQG